MKDPIFVSHQYGVTSLNRRLIMGTNMSYITVFPPSGMIFNQALIPYPALEEILVDPQSLENYLCDIVLKQGFEINQIFGQEEVSFLVENSKFDMFLEFLKRASNKLPHPYISHSANVEAVKRVFEVDFNSLVDEIGFKDVSKQYFNNQIDQICLERWVSHYIPSGFMEYSVENLIAMQFVKFMRIPICLSDEHPEDLDQFRVKINGIIYNLRNVYEDAISVIKGEYPFLYFRSAK